MKTSLKISTIGLGIGAVTLLVISFHYVRRKKYKKYNKFPESKHWKHIGSLKEIVLYPLKSSSAVELQKAICDEFGLIKFGFRDRRLIFINEADGKIASVGRYPVMLSVGIEIISDDCLVLTAPNTVSLTVNLKEFKNEQSSNFIKKLKGYSVEITEGKAEQHTWCSRVMLQKECGMKLCLTSDPILETSWWRDIPNDIIPIMAIHDKSLQELNSRLDEKDRVHQHQFRGNLFIESLENVEPFDEDKWMWLKIGDDPSTATILQYNSPCLRCIIPNIDIFSCKRNLHMEPLRTLKSYRLRSHPKEPEMGIYFDVFKTGVLKYGDAIYVQYK